MSEASAAPTSIYHMVADAFHRNRIPCLLLNLFVGAMVYSYYRMPAMAAFWETLSQLKEQGSFAFSMVSNALAAAIFPFLLHSAMGTLPEGDQARRLGLLTLFWAYRGLEIDLFYRFQGWLFGQGNDVATLAKKVCLDQFVFSPLWFVPTYLIVLRWIDHGASWNRALASLDRQFWLRTCPAVMITNWIVWIPALIFIFSMPPALQFPLCAIVMCFFILVVTLLSRVKPTISPVAEV